MDNLRFILDKHQGASLILKFAPDGWDESIISRTRNDNYYSVSEKFTTQLSFVEDGADYLRSVFYYDGFDGYCELIIQQLNDSTLQYENVFTGNVDFSTFIEERYVVKCTVNEGSFWETIKSKEKTDYEIDIDSLSPVTIESTFPSLIENRKLISNVLASIGGYTNVGFIEVGSDATLRPLTINEQATAYNQGVPNNNSFGLIEGNLNTFKITVYGDIQLFSATNTTAYIYLYKNNSQYLIDVIPLLANVLLSYSFNQTLIIPTTINDAFYISHFGGNIYGTINVDINYFAEVETKYIKALRASTVFAELLKQMNDGVAMPYNQTFFNQIYDYVITSGDAIRGLTGAKIKTNFADFFNSFNTFFGCGFGYEDNKAWMDFKSHFFQNVLIKDFGEVSDFELSVFKGWIFNAVKVGYDEQTYDDVNGRFEFNQSQDWTLPIKKIAKKVDMVSQYRADLYGIIFTSLNLEGKTTTDSDNDNDVFVIHTKTAGSNVQFNRDFELNSVQNFADPEKLFNYKLSPKRCLLRNSDFFNSFLHNNFGDVKFASGLKNTEFQVRALDELLPIKESTSLTYDLLKNALYLPYQFQFKAIIEKDFNQLINSNQNGFVSFTYKGVKLKGFIYEIGVNPSQNTEYQLKLIAHTDCDLTQIL